MRFLVLIVASVLVVAALPGDFPEPGELALILNEEDFEDFLDSWLEIEERKWTNISSVDTRSGCTIRIIGDLGQPQPVYLRNSKYISADGHSGQIRLSTGEQVYIACTGTRRTIAHPNIARSTATGTARCVNNALVSGSGWLNGNGEFGQLTCSSHSVYDAQNTSQRCYNNNLIIRVGFSIDNIFYPLYYSCFDQQRLEVLYINAGSFYPGVAVNNQYTLAQQKIMIGSYVGTALAEKYITSTQYLARGHLAAKTDYVFATGQRATFYFINAAPQWQPFNAGNWNWLEQNLRARIAAAGYSTVIYTGTFGVSQLRNQNYQLVDIYLHRDANNNPQLPVPLYYFKVVHDSSRRLGTAFVSINNPYYSEEEVRELTFCTDRCRNNSAFSWLNWQPDRIDIGYSFCCDVDDFRRTISHLPLFTVNGLLA